LSPNSKNVFDNIIYSRFLHNIKKRKIFELFFEFVKDFLKNKRTIITINNYTIIEYIININILQFFLLLIFYLFYNIDLLEIYNNIKLQISFIEFVNNINILIYNKSIKRNYKVLNKIYKKYK